jgi:hypothetical protein
MNYWSPARMTITERHAHPSEWRRRRYPPRPTPDASWQPVYIRLGAAPKEVPSQPPGYLKGMSCFRGFKTPGGRYLLDLEESVPLAAFFVWATFVQNRSAYVVEGEEVGLGIGREPLLNPVTSCSPVRTVELLGSLPSGAYVVWAHSREAQEFARRVQHYQDGR